MAKTRTFALSLFGGAALALLGAGTARADDTILIGGHTDGGCGAYASVGISGVCAEYSAGIWPFDPATMDASTDEAADVAEQIWRSDPNRYTACRGFSEGTAGCLKLAQRVPIHVILDGDPYGSTGLFRNPIVDNEIVTPMIEDGFGIPIHLPVPPGTERNFSAADIFANGGDQDLAGLFSQAVSPGHWIQTGEPDITWIDGEGVVNHEWDVDTYPWLHNGFDEPTLGEAVAEPVEDVVDLPDGE